MNSHIRNRRLHPAHSKQQDHASSKTDDNDKTSKHGNSVKPMSFASKTPTTTFDGPSHPPPSSDQRENGATSNIGDNKPVQNSATSQHITQKLPSTNAFGQTAYSKNHEKTEELHDYLNTGVQRYSIGDSDDNMAPINTTRSNGSNSGFGLHQAVTDTSVPNPFHTTNIQPTWQPLQQNDAQSHSVPFGAMNVKQNAGTNQPQFPVGNLTGWQGSFTQQMKQISEYYMSNAQEEADVADPPLLEELGIDLDDIIRHINCVLLFKSCNNGELQYGDFTGPLLILLLFAVSMLISCNLNFGLVYAIEMIGTSCMYILFNLLSQDIYIDMVKTAIILGYSLLPICLAPIIWIFSRFAKPVATVLVYLCVIWSTSTATRLLAAELNMTGRKYLVLYPTFLYYMFLAHAAMN
ncbi:Protein YIPF5 [Babesia sp. Xinjiang]|uniref:Protein YIPF5 n=1 Tax=Babesia sp. Xinjiang TaxID=462227 RepID=UPI000A21F07A|nr:Protein YIPF5 [Babesia sp. Xinjiang]ORM39425.1 Protein YIPF5 [Babesia sp. Xinjiang]